MADKYQPQQISTIISNNKTQVWIYFNKINPNQLNKLLQHKLSLKIN